MLGVWVCVVREGKVPRIVAELAATAAAPAVNFRKSLLDTPREVPSVSEVVDSTNKTHPRILSEKPLSFQVEL